MAGAWEIKASNQVLCAILHTDNTTLAWSFGLRNLILPGQLVGLSGMPYDMARNMACRMCLDGPFDWLFHLDSDVIPPRDALVRLMNRQKPLISGLYTRRSPPHGVPVMIRGGQWVTEFPQGAIVEVDLVGAGCLLIHRSLLEALPPSDPANGKHWFHWKVDRQGVKNERGELAYPPGDSLSEDFAFCKSVKEKLGVPILVDTSIVCRHVGLAESTFGSFVPLNATPVT